MPTNASPHSVTARGSTALWSSRKATAGSIRNCASAISSVIGCPCRARYPWISVRYVSGTKEDERLMMTKRSSASTA
jgi:hypothetical protein